MAEVASVEQCLVMVRRSIMYDAQAGVQVQLDSVASKP